jgi:excisionase family DNA binding protein
VDALSVITVPEAARRTGRNPETIRRWIREGKLPSRRIGTQHMVEPTDLDRLVSPFADMLPLPPHLQRTRSGAPMPTVVAAVRADRVGH